jgi:hypothetical protein
MNKTVSSQIHCVVADVEVKLGSDQFRGESSHFKLRRPKTLRRGTERHLLNLGLWPFSSFPS